MPDRFVVDVHTHIVPRGWPDLHQETGDCGPWPSLRVDGEKEAMIMLGEKEFRPIKDSSWSAEVRLEVMDEQHVDMQVLSPTPLFFSYSANGRAASQVAKIFNDLTLDIADQGKGRLIPFCQVPLQETSAAIKELERCVKNGHRGVEIGNHVGDRDLDDEGIVEFLGYCADNNIPVFVHPWDMPESPRLNRWMARWLTGMPAETHLSILSMILGRVFDRLPNSLKICFAHGGGSFPYWLGRVDNAWHRRPDLIAKSDFPPSHYTNRFSVDSVVFNDPALQLLCRTMGTDQIMLGSDFPYPLGEDPVGNVIYNSSFLTEEEQNKILGLNAFRFLNMEKPVLP